MWWLGSTCCADDVSRVPVQGPGAVCSGATGYHVHVKMPSFSMGQFVCLKSTPALLLPLLLLWQMAMLTVTVLGTPNLGNSFTKAFQRIVGVMIGELLSNQPNMCTVDCTARLAASGAALL